MVSFHAIARCAGRHVDAAEIAAIEAAVPKDAAAGDRYPARAMADLDSERVSVS
jgi:hypothetical protein